MAWGARILISTQARAEAAVTRSDGGPTVQILGRDLGAQAEQAVAGDL